jgi:hypothetical protein
MFEGLDDRNVGVFKLRVLANQRYLHLIFVRVISEQRKREGEREREGGRERG